MAQRRVFELDDNPNFIASPQRLPFSSRSYHLRGVGLSSVCHERGDVEDFLAERGVIVSRETIRLWVNCFGRHFANCVRRYRPRPNDKWHLDDVVITIRGLKHWLWRAIDADGNVLDILIQPRRNAKAAKRFLARLIARFGNPRVVITPSRDIAAQCIARQWNNAIEVSHRPMRKREKMFGRFKSARQAQSFLFAHDQINLIFRSRRHQLSASSYRHARNGALSLWADYAIEMTA